MESKTIRLQDWLRHWARELNLPLEEMRRALLWHAGIDLASSLRLTLADLEPARRLELERIFRRLARGERLERILQRTYFYGVEIGLNDDCLIPRPDSERLVDHALEALEGEDGQLRILDLCCGSACLAIATIMAWLERGHRLADLTLSLVDLSPGALEMAAQNVARSLAGLEPEITCLDVLGEELQDYLQAESRRYELCLFNPPYLTSREYEASPPDYREADPELALVAGAEGLIFYQRVLGLLPMILAPRGRLVLEHGKDQQAAILALVQDSWPGRYEISSFRDYQGWPRGMVIRDMA